MIIESRFSDDSLPNSDFLKNAPYFRLFVGSLSQLKLIRSLFETLPVKTVLQRYRRDITIQRLEKMLLAAEMAILVFIMEKGKNNLIGWGELFKSEVERRYLEMGFLIHPQYQRRGIGTFLTRYLFELAHTNEFPNIEACIAHIQGQNTAARKIMDRLVKKYEGRRVVNMNNASLKYIIPLRR